MVNSLLLAGAVLSVAGSLVNSSQAADLSSLIRQIRSVGAEGSGNVQARSAWKELASSDLGALPRILDGMNGANDYAKNWLRSALETIAQREASLGKAIPAGTLVEFVRNRDHDPGARRLAFELFAKVRPGEARDILPEFLNDPGTELRREAVQAVVNEASGSLKAGNKSAATQNYQRALAAARDPDQIEEIAKSLTDLGSKPDLQKTFGWLTRWKVIGPFSNTNRTGFDRVFPPESNLDFSATHDGTDGKVAWKDFESRSDFGLVDFNQPFTALKQVTAYGAAEHWSDRSLAAELRLGCKNGWKIWLNGRFLFGREEYHRGMEIDQYRIPVQLQSGRNVILVKCTQNEQKEDWTKEWEFQLRITDSSGTPIPSTR